MNNRREFLISISLAVGADKTKTTDRVPMLAKATVQKRTSPENMRNYDFAIPENMHKACHGENSAKIVHDRISAELILFLFQNIE